MPIQITPIASTFYLRCSSRLLNTVYPQFLNADFMIFNLLKFSFVRNFIRNKIKQLNIEVNGVNPVFLNFTPKIPILFGLGVGLANGFIGFLGFGCWLGYCFFLGFQGLALGWVEYPKPNPKTQFFLGSGDWECEALTKRGLHLVF